MVDDDVIMSFIRSQQFEIKYLANESITAEVLHHYLIRT